MAKMEYIVALEAFEQLGLTEKTLRAIEKKGFETPSPIQTLAIPRLLTESCNLIARARTGTGKTAAFGLPLVEKIEGRADHVQALILTPTRELALQITVEMESFDIGRTLRILPVYGGQGMRTQINALRDGVDIIVGTPGRVMDHMRSGRVKFDQIDFFILDEADEMLDMGFVEDIETIFADVNQSARVMLFSATMPKRILQIARKFMGDYEIVEEEAMDDDPVVREQKYWVVKETEKTNALIRLIDISPDFYGLVFTQTKSDADMVARALDEAGYEAVALHGDIAQAQREKILQRFRRGKTRIVVATDVAARGIDVAGLSHVVNYSLPHNTETYIHRIGRTGRAGAGGCAFTFIRPSEAKFVQKFVRASKGKLEQGKIPSADEVVEAKRARLFDAVQNKYSELGEKDENDVFADLADKLCDGKDPKDILTAMLKKNYASTLDPARYGAISSEFAREKRERRERGERGEREERPERPQVQVGENQMRLFISLGKKDDMGGKDIARFCSETLDIEESEALDIDVAPSFSLVTLPKEAGEKLLAMCAADSSLPHAHVDSRPMKGGKPSRRSGGRRRDDFDDDDDFGERGFGRGRRPRRFGRDDDYSRRERGGFRHDRGGRRERSYERFDRDDRFDKRSKFHPRDDRKAKSQRRSFKSSDIY